MIMSYEEILSEKSIIYLPGKLLHYKIIRFTLQNKIKELSF